MFSNMKIRTRLLFSYAVIIVILMIASVAAMFMVRDVGANLNTFYDNNYTVTVSAWIVRRAQQAAHADLLYAILTQDSAVEQQKIESVKQNLATIRESFPIIRSAFKGDLGLMDQIDDVLEETNAYRDQLYELIAADKDDEAFVVIPRLDKMAELLVHISDAADQDAQEMVAAGDRAVVFSTVVVYTILGVSVLCAILLALSISNSVRKPVNEIEKAAKMISDGNLSADITYQSRDELGSLSDSMRTTVSRLSSIIGDLTYLQKGVSCSNFNLRTNIEQNYVGDFRPLLLTLRNMNTELSKTMRQINRSAEQVASGSDQVSSGAQALSQGAAEQASSVEELAATINKISSKMEENAQSAQQGCQIADAAGKKMEESNRQMQELIVAMADINDKSGKIGKINKTIKDIAFQTNILALNAAVEAARAGVAGKGFAVVADEVRNLASKSAEASKSTAALIEGTIQAIENGTKLADHTANTLAEVVVNTRQVVDVVDTISQASKEQVVSISQVTQGIGQISSVIQTNSATAEESAAASEELSGQAQILKDMVGKFNLKE